MTSVEEATLLLRVALGLVIIAHGYNKVFGPGGIEGTTRWFASLGLRPAGLHARTAAVSEIGVGVLLIVGLCTPVAAAGLVGLMWVAARTDHRGKGLFVFAGGWEYTALVAICGVVLSLTGPGRYSLDALWGVPGGGAIWGSVGPIAGLMAGALLLGTSFRPDHDKTDN